MGNSSYWDTRIKNIKDSVSMRQLIDYFNVPCQSHGEITQVHCPFHGNDQHASARIYETNTMYCWVCSKMWDVISFIQDYKGVDFGNACSVLEDMFNISKTDKSIAYYEESFIDFVKNKQDIKEKDFEKDFEKISKLLISNRDSFSLPEYVKYFYFFDNLYSNYKSNKYSDDKVLCNSLSNLFKEISAKY